MYPLVDDAAGVGRTVLSEHEADLAVEAKDDVAEGVAAVTLADPAGATLPAWTPGAHVDLVLDDALTRQYSLCGNPADRTRWRIGVLRDPASRGGSAFVHERLQVGSTVRVRGPRNHFPLVSANRYRFIAGGIGITPLIPMMAEATATGADWSLLYGGRQRGSMAFLDELSGYGDRIHVHPQDELGMLDLAAVLGVPEPGDAGLLLRAGGPARRGGGPVPDVADREPPPRALLGQAAGPGGGGRGRVRARAPALGHDARGAGRDVDPRVCEDAGVSVLGSCYEGICGTCETAVVDGEIDHRDSVLTEEEQSAGDVMMICVSRCKGPRLTLDL